MLFSILKLAQTVISLQKWSAERPRYPRDEQIHDKSSHEIKTGTHNL